MKKFLTMALMAAFATTSFAQDATVKEAKKLFGKGDFDAAAQMLTPALTSGETLDKAAAWNLLSEIMYGKWSAISSKQMENQVKKLNEETDTLGMHQAAVAARCQRQGEDEVPLTRTDEVQELRRIARAGRTVLLPEEGLQGCP